MEIVLASCTVRSWRRGDEASLVRHANDREVWINLRDQFPHPYTPADAKRWLDWVASTKPETNFAIAVAGAAVGGVGFVIQSDVHRCSAEVGYWLGREFWGRGIMTQALRGLTIHAFANHDLCRLFAYVFQGNLASQRVLEKAGYEYEGRLRRSVVKEGQVLDQMLYAFTREP